MLDKWSEIASLAVKNLSKAHALIFFKHTAILAFEKNVLTIGLPRESFRPWMEEKAKNALLLAAKEINPAVCGLVFLVDGALETESDFDPRSILGAVAPDKKKAKNSGKITAKKFGSRAVISRSQAGFSHRFLNPNLTLKHFVDGPNTALARAAVEAVIKAPGKKYNPLFLFGDVGLGKTHLLHAIGNAVATEYSDASIVLLPAQNFVDEVVKMVRTGKSDEIRAKFRASDLFMLDDVQFLKGKNRTQEILFHIFNDLHHAGKQIVFASDCPPSKLDGLEDRLVSRFGMGMVADIQSPDFETRLAILEEKTEEAEMDFDKKILEIIAENVNGSVRELLGTLRQIVANFELQGIRPNRTNILDILKKRNRDVRFESDSVEVARSGRVISIEEIAERTAEFFEVPPEKLISSSRLKEFTMPRQVAMWFAHRKLKEPLQKIGNYFGGRDHTSVLSAVRKVERDRKTSTEFWRNVNALRKKMGL